MSCLVVCVVVAFVVWVLTNLVRDGMQRRSAPVLSPDEPREKP